MGESAVTGDININSTSEIFLYGDSGFAIIGDSSLVFDRMGNAAQGQQSGNLTVASASYISLEATDGGSSRIESGGATSGTISVTAAGDIYLTTDSGSGSSIVQIGAYVIGTGGPDVSVTSTAGQIVLDAEEDSSRVMIGNLGRPGPSGIVGGNIAVAAADIFDGNVTLQANGSGSLVQIGNGEATGSTPNAIGGNITVTSGASLIVETSPDDVAEIGNFSASGAALSGSVLLNLNSVDVSNDTQNSVSASFVNDLQYGDITLTDVADLNFAAPVLYSSSHTFNLLTVGNLNILEPIQNSGNGTINLVAGWDGATLNPAQFGNAGVYGNNGGSVNIGGSSATGDVAVGTAQGALNAYVGSLNLNSNNGLAQFGYHGAASGNISVVATQNINAFGNSSQNFGIQLGNGSLLNDITGNVSGNINLTAGGQTAFFSQVGESWLGNHAASGFTSSGNVTSLSISGSYSADFIEGDLGTSANSGGDVFLAFDEDPINSIGFRIGNIEYNSPHNFSFLVTGSLDIVGSVINDGTGALTVVSGWDGHTFGTAAQIKAAGAYGLNGATLSVGGEHDYTIGTAPNTFSFSNTQTSNISVGTEGGTTTVLADNVTVAPLAGFYSQIGYFGGSSGAIDVKARGDVTLAGGSTTGGFAQIGNGGYLSTGLEGGNIAVNAAGFVSLLGGTGTESYAQIGLGGAEANSNSSGYSNSGAVTVTASDVVLGGGSGSGSYAQIGQGGYLLGSGLTGSSVNSGDISVSVAHSITLVGGGADAYAQIGNGGDQLNLNAAASASGLVSGNVSAIAPSGATGVISIAAGSGAHSYASIGNGGYAINLSPNAVPANFNISGDLVIADLSLTGSNTGADGFAGIGNGDPTGTGIGNVSGGISISANGAVQVTNGTAPGTGVALGNFTGAGTVSGGLTTAVVTSGGTPAITGAGATTTTTTPPPTTTTTTTTPPPDTTTTTTPPPATTTTTTTPPPDTTTTTTPPPATTTTTTPPPDTTTTTTTPPPDTTTTTTNSDQVFQIAGGLAVIVTQTSSKTTSIAVTADKVSTATLTIVQGGNGTTSAIQVATQVSSQGPLAILTGGTDQETSTPADDETKSIADSLDGSKKSSTAKPVVPGLLTQFSTSNAANQVHGVPPANQDFSSWGNQALWQ